MTDPFFNPQKEFLKALWKVIALFAIAAIIVCVCASCHTPKSVQTERVEVHLRDTVRIVQRDTVRIQVHTEASNAQREEVTQRIVTVYDTLGRVRTIVQEDKASRLVANYYRQQYDSLLSLYIQMQHTLQTDSLAQQHHEEPVTKHETFGDRLANTLLCIGLMLLFILCGAAVIAYQLRKRYI